MTHAVTAAIYNIVDVNCSEKVWHYENTVSKCMPSCKRKFSMTLSAVQYDPLCCTTPVARWHVRDAEEGELFLP